MLAMKNVPKIGLAGERRFPVESQHAIAFTEGGMPAVLSTPSLIGFLEATARLALAVCLDDGENSVGIEIEVRHLAPTPTGQTVLCLARVIHVDGSRIAFQLEARDEQEVIARGYHRRQVVRVASFAKRVKAKTTGGHGGSVK
jgi:fluoroacetyl-CoA thioesterase